MRRAVICPLRVDLAGYWTALAQDQLASLVSVAVTPGIEGKLVLSEPGQPLARLRHHGQYVSTQGVVPPLSGLGASSASAIAWTAMIRSSVKNTSDRRTLAGYAVTTEASLGMLGCPLDAYACAVGGLTCVRRESEIEVTQIGDVARPGSALVDRVVLVRVPRLTRSSALWQVMAEAANAGAPGISAALSTMGRIAGAVPDLLACEDWRGVAEAVSENWAAEHQLGDRPAVREADDVLELARRHGASAGKLCGSGGCLMLVVDPDRRDQLRASLHHHRLQTITIDYAQYGVQLKGV